MDRESKNEVMKSMFGNVINILIQLGFEKKDIVKYTTIGILTQLHKYDKNQIIRIVDNEIKRNKSKKHDKARKKRI